MGGGEIQEREIQEREIQERKIQEREIQEREKGVKQNSESVLYCRREGCVP